VKASVATELSMFIQKSELEKKNNVNVYHNARLLLKIYSSAVWNTRIAADDLLDSYSEAYQINDIAGLQSLVSMDENNNVKRLEDRLRSVAQNKIIIDIVERSMLHVKEYPRLGELYFSIINKNFVVKYPYTESEMLESLNLSRSTYYRRRKESITTFGVSLWGYILPDVLDKLNPYYRNILRQN